MRTVLLTLVLALWIGAIAIVTVQNATPVSIRFLAGESVALPVGVALSFCAAGSMVITALLLVGLGGKYR